MWWDNECRLECPAGRGASEGGRGVWPGCWAWWWPPSCGPRRAWWPEWARRWGAVCSGAIETLCGVMDGCWDGGWVVMDGCDPAGLIGRPSCDDDEGGYQASIWGLYSADAWLPPCRPGEERLDGVVAGRLMDGEAAPESSLS